MSVVGDAGKETADRIARHDDVAVGGGRSLMAPYRVLREFLSDTECADLLRYTLEHETAFKPTKVGRSGKDIVVPTIRISTSTRDLGDFRPLFEGKLVDLAPQLAAEFRMNVVQSPKIELQLVAHGDGAFYRRHIDTQTAADRYNIRVLSGVYYFHNRPKAFSGGVLRLHAIGDDPDFVDIEPEHNTLLVFPAWAPHEVRPVSCPSNLFADSRFAINCWFYRRRPAA